MSHSIPLRQEVRALLALGLPIMATQLLQHGLSFVDIVMAGNASAVDLAAVSLGAAIYLPIFLFVSGVLVVLSALVSHAAGAETPERAVIETHQGAWLGVVLGLVGLLLCQQGAWLLGSVDVLPEVRDKAVAYLAAAGYSLPAVGLYQALRSYCEGFGRTRAVMLFTGAGFLLNIPADYALVFGAGPLPAQGGVGCGWATSTVNWVILLFAWYYTRFQAPQVRLPSLYRAWQAPDIAEIGHLLRLGIPIALAIFFEASLFSVMSLLVADLGTVVLAGHQIAYNLSATTYMVPLAMGVAISVRAGYFLGRQEPGRARLACKIGMGLSIAFACLCAAAIVLSREAIAAFYSSNAEVRQVAEGLLLMAALFQIPDAIQASAAGALRGYRDTRAIMLATLGAYWGLGLPLGYLLARGLGPFPIQGVWGYWDGLIIGLSAAAVVLILRLQRVSRHAL